MPSLRDRKGNISKKWYVEVSQRNHRTDEMARRCFELFDGVNINDLPTKDERYKLAERLIKEFNAKLRNGWVVYEDNEKAVYEDQTQYHQEARIFKRMIASNKAYGYWISKYIKEVLKDKGLRSGTLVTYTSRYRVFQNWLFKNEVVHLDVSAITNDVIIRFFRYLRDDRKHTAHTASSYANLLKELFDFILSNGSVTKNPVYNLPVNKTVKDLGAERIHKDDLKKIMEVMDEKDPQLALACRFEYYCGLRPGFEIRLMKAGDLYLRSNVSKVRISAENAKTNRRKEVVIPDVFLEYLLNVRKFDKCNPEFYVFGRNKEPGPERLGKNTLRDRFNRIRNELKLPDIYKLYSFKHTGAVTLAEQGESLINIRDHLDHTDIYTTEIYLRRHGFNESKIIRHNFPKI
ncbi:MAG: site-specific integrase [Prevotellaceae bacterium]|nr:site-specific integrase [Prevotellaceae bacterium]